MDCPAQVNDVRLEIIEQGSPLAAHLAIAERARKRSQLRHILGPVLFPGTIQIFGIVHRENGNLVTMLLEQLLQVEHVDTVATATIVEFVSEKDFQDCDPFMEKTFFLI